MKKITILLFLICYSFSYAQSSNLDRENFNVSYVKLPSNPILDDSKRTYSSNTGAITISGFSRLKSNGTIDINYTFNGTEIGEVNINKRKIEKKNKEGKVISTSYKYKVTVPYNSTAIMTVSNAITAESYEKTFSESTVYESSEYDSYNAAQNHYNNNRSTLRNKYKSSHSSNLKSNAKSHLDYTYGYIPYENKYEYFWILSSKNHPEYGKHQEAYQKLKTIFDGMKYDQPIENLNAEVIPIIDYFNDVAARFPGDKRKIRKIRYASYYNIAKIYYYLDQPEKTREYAQKIIDNDYDKGDGESFLSDADKLAEKLKINEIDSRHLAVVTEDLSHLPTEEENEEEVAEKTIDLDINKAFLITKENDTLAVDIKTSDIPAIAYTLKTVEYDNNGTPIGTRSRNASKCKELVFVDSGARFKNVEFKESSLKSGEVDAGQMLLGGATEKLCLVLYESDKINLYKFAGKELVLYPEGAKKGKSTISAAFLLGFKNNLAKMAGDCEKVASKAKNKEYSNDEDGLLKFCKELSDCSSSEAGN